MATLPPPQPTEKLSPDIMDAVVNALPSHPERMWVYVLHADHSDIARQLRTLPYLDTAEFCLGNANQYSNGRYIALIANPSNAMLSGIVRTGYEFTKAREALVDKLNGGNASEAERKEFIRGVAKLKVYFHRAEWNYDAEKILYDWNPAKKRAEARHPGGLHPGYPKEAGLDDVVDSFRKQIEAEPDKGRILYAKNLKIHHPPSSQVVITPELVTVMYKIEEPSYLSPLVGILSGTGKLNIDRRVCILPYNN